MTEDQLVDSMLNIADDLTGLDPDENTITGDVVKQDDGFGSSNSANYFKYGTEFAIHSNGGKIKPWPADWLQKTFRQIASVIAMLLLVFSLNAQLNVNLSAVKTELHKGAISFGLSYIKQLDSLYGGKETIIFGSHSSFAFTPVFNLQAGTNEALNSIEAKIEGLYMVFGTRKLDNGIVIPNFAKTFSTFPFDIGIETNTEFTFLNTIVQAGYVPVFMGKDNPDWLRHTHLGVFVQAGYKFYLDSTGTIKIGGAQDQSEENFNSAILRLKGSIKTDTGPIVKISFVQLGLVGSADLWFDLKNNATYNRVEGALRVYLGNNNSFDLTYQHGSGAPNFNSDDQFGFGVNISL